MKKATRLMMMDNLDEKRNGDKPMSRAGITDRNYDPGEPDWGGARMNGQRGGRKNGRMDRDWDDEEDYRGSRPRRKKWDDDDDDDDRGSRRDRDWRGNRIWASGTVMSEPGGREHGGMEKVDEQHARKWVKKMHNADGGSGGHFNEEKAEELRHQFYPEGDKWEWFVAINMMHSDYAHVAKKMNADKDEFYACMAKAFLDDPDAGEGKLMKYMKYIPEK